MQHVGFRGFEQLNFQAPDLLALLFAPHHRLLQTSCGVDESCDSLLLSFHESVPQRPLQQAALTILQLLHRLGLDIQLTLCLY